ncbi:MAG: DUF3881 family protein [Lachnospiraceae bacterium]|nr:DUF3881 family protein [Lachnospiraceae bacterium]
MHKYMRAIGFSEYSDRKKLKELLTDVVLNADERSYTMNNEGIMIGEFCRNFADRMGIAVCGEFDEDDKFIYEYYYPYLIGDEVTTNEDVTVERHAARESYAGMCDEVKVGISLIFYLQDMIPYVKAKAMGMLPVRGTSLTLTGLSTGGMIIMPIQKNESQKERVRKESAERNHLLAAARKGDEDAIETLTLEDMDLYTSISKRIQKEDVYSMVDTYFMPYGMECDQYSVLGEILQVELISNQITGEQIFLLKICSNELTFDVSINIIDLFGEPQVGRRFKGSIWLQGKINFPEQL